MHLKTKDARIFYHAGMIEKALGNQKGAIKYLERERFMNPAFDLIQAEKARKMLEELKNRHESQIETLELKKFSKLKKLKG